MFTIIKAHIVFIVLRNHNHNHLTRSEHTVDLLSAVKNPFSIIQPKLCGTNCVEGWCASRRRAQSTLSWNHWDASEQDRCVIWKCIMPYLVIMSTHLKRRAQWQMMCWQGVVTVIIAERRARSSPRRLRRAGMPRSKLSISSSSILCGCAEIHVSVIAPSHQIPQGLQPQVII